MTDTQKADPRPPPPDVPKLNEPIHISAQQKEAEDAVEDAEAVPSIDFGNGLVIHPTELNGLEERRVRLASSGFFPTAKVLYEMMQEGSVESFGALLWVARLRESGLTPQQAAEGNPGFTYDDCLEDMTVAEMGAVGERTQEMMEADEESPT